METHLRLTFIIDKVAHIERLFMLWSVIVHFGNSTRMNRQ